MFEKLSDKLEKAFSLLKGHGRITEINVAQTLKEVRRALIDADVSYQTAKKFVQQVKDKALGQQVLTSLNPGQLMVKIVHDELADLMGSEAAHINIDSKFTIILIAGLQGSGKTTFSGKLANYLRRNNSSKPMLIACDVYRPAAIDQLEVVANSISVPIYKDLNEKNPVKIAQAGILKAKQDGHNLVIVDTAGRLAVDDVMMNEISSIKDSISPTEILFVVDSMTGQDAVNTARKFNEVLNYDGVVLTKLDGDTRGGAALTIKSEVDKPIKFIGTGEKMDALDVFYPSRMADRILGMGDVVSLVEKASQDLDEEKIKAAEENLKKGKFTFEDYLMQIRQMKKMGGMEGVLSLLPGVGRAKEQMKNANVDEKLLSENEAIILSMTKKERENPEIVSGSRRKRISLGSGTDVQAINRLLKQFKMMSKMMKKMSKGKMPKGQIPDELLNNLK